jgi:hypothetical protein
LLLEFIGGLVLVPIPAQLARVPPPLVRSPRRCGSSDSACSAISRPAPLRHRSRQLFEPIKTVPAITHNPTCFGHVAQLQYPNLGLDHLICRVISPRFLPAALRCFSDYEDFITTVRLNLSTYTLVQLEKAVSSCELCAFPQNGLSSQAVSRNAGDHGIGSF